jgi:hypothetical protein
VFFAVKKAFRETASTAERAKIANIQLVKISTSRVFAFFEVKPFPTR